MLIIIPGFLITLLTFPGVILHEMVHKFFCDYYNVPVYKVRYFSLGKQAGYVIHAPMNDSRKNAIIGLAPLLINSMVFIAIFIPFFIPIIIQTSFVSKYMLQDFFLIWVGISCGINAIPSKADIAHIDNNVSRFFVFIKKFVRFLNFTKLAGTFLWLGILFLITMLTILVLWILAMILYILLLIPYTIIEQLFLRFV